MYVWYPVCPVGAAVWYPVVYTAPCAPRASAHGAVYTGTVVNIGPFHVYGMHCFCFKREKQSILHIVCTTLPLYTAPCAA